MDSITPSDAMDQERADWLDPSRRRDQDEGVKARLECWADSGRSMAGFELAGADLEDVYLVNHGDQDGYDLSGADLHRANLRQAHLFGINLQGASLMKADCTNANFHCANLAGCNLLGTKLDGAKLENVNWGDELLQEQQAREAFRRGDEEAALDFMQQAEEIYRNLRKVCEYQGLFEFAGHFFYKEMIARRQQVPFWSARRGTLFLVDLFCGYGERPARVILFSMALIVLFAFLYFLVGVKGPDGTIVFSLQAGLLENLLQLGRSVYFSVVTFTTLGYGDIVPLGAARVAAALEAFIGSFTLALFVVVFVKKMTR